jgi:hypothetical protein
MPKQRERCLLVNCNEALSRRIRHFATHKFPICVISVIDRDLWLTCSLFHNKIYESLFLGVAVVCRPPDNNSRLF